MFSSILVSQYVLSSFRETILLNLAEFDPHFFFFSTRFKVYLYFGSILAIRPKLVLGCTDTGLVCLVPTHLPWNISCYKEGGSKEEKKWRWQWRRRGGEVVVEKKRWRWDTSLQEFCSIHIQIWRQGLQFWVSDLVDRWSDWHVPNINQCTIAWYVGMYHGTRRKRRKGRRERGGERQEEERREEEEAAK